MAAVSGIEGTNILTGSASSDILNGLGGDDSYRFDSRSDFENTHLAAVKITSLSAIGSLHYHNGSAWVVVTLDQVISKADLAAGKPHQACVGLRRYQGLRGQRPVLRPETGHLPGASVKASRPRGSAHAL